MEGFLQSLKFRNPDMQKYVCTLVGFSAKKMGSKKNWKTKGVLYWQGKTIDRFSDDYQHLLDKAYNALFENRGFRKALLSTGSAVLTHNIGARSKSDTILTKQEFCSRLTRLREQGRGLF